MQNTTEKGENFSLRHRPACVVCVVYDVTSQPFSGLHSYERTKMAAHQRVQIRSKKRMSVGLILTKQKEVYNCFPISTFD